MSGDNKTSVDTTKTYYEDSEAPEYQLQITNGVEKKVPWEEVPEARRYIVRYGRPPGPKPVIRVPIVRVEMISLDENGQPVEPEQAYGYRYTEVGLNPEHKRHGIGGEQH